MERLYRHLLGMGLYVSPIFADAERGRIAHLHVSIDLPSQLASDPAAAPGSRDPRAADRPPPDHPPAHRGALPGVQQPGLSGGDRDAVLRPAGTGRAAGMNGWQPIATAPRDGTTIILWHGDSGLRDRVVVGAYDKRAAHPWRFLNNPFPLTGNAHDGDGDGMANAFLTAPTHWQPLPEPPK